MYDKQEKQLSPGGILTLKIPVTASVILTIAVVVLTYLYATRESWRSTITFFGAAAGIAAGILSAFYVGRGLRITIEQRDKALKDDKISRAFVLAQRWNEPNLARVREDWRALLEEIDEKNEHEVCEILHGDHHKKAIAADVMNFFEEVGYAVRSGVADIETLKNTHRSIVVHYYSTISPWINKIRRDEHQQTAYEHFEWLRDQWK